MTDANESSEQLNPKIGLSFMSSGKMRCHLVSSCYHRLFIRPIIQFLIQREHTHVEEQPGRSWVQKQVDERTESQLDVQSSRICKCGFASSCIATVWRLKDVIF